MYLIRFTNPKLTGVIIKESVKCGKDNCQCINGNFHKWYYYLYYRDIENGRWKLKKEYVKRNKVKYLRKQIKEMKDKDRVSKKRLMSNIYYLGEALKYLKGSMSVHDLIKDIYEIS